MARAGGGQVLNAIGIEAAAESWKVVHARRSAFGPRVVTRFTLEGAEQERAAALRRYIVSKGLWAARLCLALPAGEYAGRALRLPATQSETVQGMLAFELESHLPSNPSEWRHTCEVLDKAGNQSTILLGAARAESIDMALGPLHGERLSPAVVTTRQRALMKALSGPGGAPGAHGASIVTLRRDGALLEGFSKGAPCYARRLSARQLGRLRQEIRSMAGSMGGGPGRCLVIDEGAGEGASEAARAAAKECGLCVDERAGGLEASAALGAAMLLFDRRKRAPSLVAAPARPGAGKKAAFAAGAAAALCAALFAASVAVDSVELRRLDAALSGMEPLARKAGELKASVASVEADLETLEALKGASSPDFLDLLRRLTQLIPSDTYLTGMEYDRHKVVVEGSSAMASALFMTLERSGFASEIEFDGPVTAGRDGKERFRIRFRPAAGAAKAGG